ncbi:MAG TPA: DUF4388 domain-containing protein [Ktedonobacteraceae bacterium]|jgi:hypothetical protein
MTEQRDAAAASVGGLLEIARVEQRNGLLHLTCAQGGLIEEGEIYLLGGQPVYARAGNLAGTPALYRLANWRRVSFSFAANAPRPAANIFPASSQPEPTPARAPFWPLPEPGLDQLVPRKVESAREVLSLPLTRRQRLIYFLVDGQRTVADLARTTHKTAFDVGTILGELQGQGLVVVVRPVG